MKIGKNTLVKLIFFKENECQAVEQYLEERALEGWLLDDISCGFFVFRKSEPRKCKFTVDIFTDLKAGEYREYCEASGWNYLCETSKYFIFSTQDENITPIQTDEEIMLQKVSKSILLNIFIYIWCISIVMRNVYNTFFDNNFGNSREIYGNYYLFLIIILSVFIICPIIDMARSSRWYFKYKKALKLEEDIKYPTLKELKIKMTYFNLFIWMLVLVILCLMGDLSDSKAYIYIGLAIFAIIISISNIIKIIRK